MDTAASDGELARRCLAGDRQAYGELVQRHQHAVFNVCLRLMGERREAEDLAQEAFLRAYQRLALYDPARPFGPWMRQVAANLCLNALERRPAETLAYDEQDEPPAPPQSNHPEALLEQRQQAAILHRALLSLPPRYRLVVELRHYQELSYNEIAAALEIPLSDVKSDLFRARQMLAKRLTSPERGDPHDPPPG
jgi:RNA polymerase sigma-70 factor (ECF subfamily)